MPGKDYTVVLLVDQTPKQVYEAVNNVRGWWSGDITGSTDRLGAEWSYRYQDLHRSTQKEWKPTEGVVRYERTYGMRGGTIPPSWIVIGCPTPGAIGV